MFPHRIVKMKEFDSVWIRISGKYVFVFGIDTACYLCVSLCLFVSLLSLSLSPYIFVSTLPLALSPSSFSLSVSPSIFFSPLPLSLCLFDSVCISLSLSLFCLSLSLYFSLLCLFLFFFSKPISFSPSAYLWPSLPLSFSPWCLYPYSTNWVKNIHKLRVASSKPMLQQNCTERPTNWIVVVLSLFH